MFRTCPPATVLVTLLLSSCSAEAPPGAASPGPSGPATSQGPAPNAPAETPMPSFKEASVAESLELLEDTDNLVLIDVRTPGETSGGIIPGALLIPMQDLPGRLDEIPEGPVLVYCHVGARSAAVCDFLIRQGRTEVYNLDGGIVAWTGELVLP